MAEFQIKTSENGKVQGPFSSGQLKKLVGQGKLRPEHLVSANGGASWQPATGVVGLKFPLPASSSQTPPPSPQENSPPPQRLSKWVIVGGGIGVLCLVVCSCGVGFLIAPGSGDVATSNGDDGSHPAVELDSSARPSAANGTPRPAPAAKPVTALSREEFRSRFLNKSPAVLLEWGRPDRTREVGDSKYWFYFNVTYDSVTQIVDGKVQVVIRDDKITSINF